jgi:hypothetical protein
LNLPSLITSPPSSIFCLSSFYLPLYLLLVFQVIIFQWFFFFLHIWEKTSNTVFLVWLILLNIMTLSYNHFLEFDRFVLQFALVIIFLAFLPYFIYSITSWPAPRLITYDGICQYQWNEHGCSGSLSSIVTSSF